MLFVHSIFILKKFENLYINFANIQNKNTMSSYFNLSVPISRTPRLPLPTHQYIERNKPSMIVTPVSINDKSKSRQDWLEQVQRRQHGKMHVWDDSKQNCASKGDLFAYVENSVNLKEDNKSKGWIEVFVIKNVYPPEYRLLSWSDNVGQGDRNVLELSSDPIYSGTMVEWKEQLGYKERYCVQGTIYLKNNKISGYLDKITNAKSTTPISMSLEKSSELIKVSGTEVDEKLEYGENAVDIAGDRMAAIFNEDLNQDMSSSSLVSPLPAGSLFIIRSNSKSENGDRLQFDYEMKEKLKKAPSTPGMLRSMKMAVRGGPQTHDECWKKLKKEGIVKRFTSTPRELTYGGRPRDDGTPTKKQIICPSPEIIIPTFKIIEDKMNWSHLHNKRNKPLYGVQYKVDSFQSHTIDSDNYKGNKERWTFIPVDGGSKWWCHRDEIDNFIFGNVEVNSDYIWT